MLSELASVADSHIYLYMCVIDMDVFKIVLLTTTLPVLDMAETSPHGIIFNNKL